MGEGSAFIPILRGGVVDKRRPDPLIAMVRLRERQMEVPE